MEAELDFGNARVRALKSRLLSPADYDRLVALDTDQLVVALGDSAYRTDIDERRTHGAGRRLLHEALSVNLARTLLQVQRSYAGTARRGIELFTGRWDVANLVSILRGQLSGTPPDEVAALLVPAGRIDRGTLLELARQPDTRTTLEMMIAWRLPHPGTATDLLATWRRFERSPPLAALEMRLRRSLADEVAEALSEGWVPAELEQQLRASIDAHDIMAALRLLSAADRGEPEARDVFLRGGTISEAVLQTMVRAPSAADAIIGLLAVAGQHAFAPALLEHVSDGDLGRLEESVDRIITDMALRGFWQADPLSLAVPVAYVFAKEREVSRLRLVVEAAAGRLPKHEVRKRWLA